MKLTKRQRILVDLANGLKMRVPAYMGRTSGTWLMMEDDAVLYRVSPTKIRELTQLGLISWPPGLAAIKYVELTEKGNAIAAKLLEREQE